MGRMVFDFMMKMIAWMYGGILLSALLIAGIALITMLFYLCLAYLYTILGEKTPKIIIKILETSRFSL